MTFILSEQDFFMSVPEEILFTVKNMVKLAIFSNVGVFY